MMMDPELRKQLRDEANSVKDCFTTFSFQALALSGLVLGAIASLQPNHPWFGVAGILVIVVVLTVSRIGAYKYATANRHFAFELYSDTLASEEEKGVGWEEALRAWRVVQATLFEEIYYTREDYKKWNPWRYIRYNNVQRENLKGCQVTPENPVHRSNESEWWFNAKEQVGPSASWYPGRYLETMQWILHLTAGLAVIPLVVMALQLAGEKYAHTYLSLGAIPVQVHWLAWIVATLMALTVLVRSRQMNARRELLEYGLLSIAIATTVWQVVIKAHLLAEKRAGGRPDRYLRALGEEARMIADSAGCIWDWLEKQS